ncbi:hypothetical protein AMATHDRAFT_72036 [Amanita thiersii Skay4041]|uniref:G-protein coupled receptors family 1 profile domain-containing protein n=1 Tax=Amanita thiersii Skay4041 TaxID=703135 RepID=A0A2A9NBB3_9AGAR|nr:hypothetical protein AMATHDRAFT_72036 [Amanita thiersii Skay4041]
MSPTINSSQLSHFQLPPPPTGLNYLLIINPSLSILMTELVGTAILLPLLIILFFFSTKQLRWKPIFILNVISILLGMTMGIIGIWAMYQGITNPHKPISSAHYGVIGVLITIVPLFVETILMFRILAVYPYHATSKWLFTLIFLPLTLLKIARLVNISIYIKHYLDILNSFEDPIIAGQVAWSSVGPNPKIEWILQVVDNTAASCLFLYKLDIRNTLSISRYTASNSSRDAYTSLIKGLFWIAVSNFIFPVLLSIAQLIFVFRDPDFVDGSLVLLVNDYVEIVGVLLATVWVAGAHWSSDHIKVSSERSLSLPPMHFASTPLSLSTRNNSSSMSTESELEDENDPKLVPRECKPMAV